MRALLAILVLSVAPGAHDHTRSGNAGDPRVPSAPHSYVTDGAGVLARGERAELEGLLRSFEAETTAQVIVYIAERLPAGAALEDYATRCFNEWGVGQAEKNNGVVLFVFSADRKIRIEVGLGLEAALSNAYCKQVIDSAIVPELRRGHYGAGVKAGLRGILTRIREKGSK